MRKPNWTGFTQSLYSWEVVKDELTCFESRVRHVSGKKYGRNVDGFQVLEIIWDMSFADFLRARELVKKYNKASIISKYKIRYTKKI